MDCGPSGGFAGEGMKAADDALEESGPPDFGAPNGTAAYRAEAPLKADESLFLQLGLPLSALIATLRCIVLAIHQAECPTQSSGIELRTGLHPIKGH